MLSFSHASIRHLSPSLVNKIAAGEVIERPASVVKELMENAVDAGATRIDVSVVQGGLEMVRVVDNGGGIPADELPLALASHATSKIVEADDLFRVGTLGFRGEALASIAEVSRLVLRSRTPESPGGRGDRGRRRRLGDVAPCGCPVGTTVEVHNLFFNTPVRRKFLRTTATEFGHVSEAFTRIALATPQVHFTLRHNDKPVFELAAGDGWLERIARCFGRELAEQPDLGRERRGRGAAVGLCGPSQPEPQPQPHAVFLPQRPAHPRPGAAARPGRGLSRAADGRPLADRLSGDEDAAGTGRRERPSHEAGGPLPGFRPALQPTAGARCGQVPDDRSEARGLQSGRRAMARRPRPTPTRPASHDAAQSRPVAAAIGRLGQGQGGLVGRRGQAAGVRVGGPGFRGRADAGARLELRPLIGSTRRWRASLPRPCPREGQAVRPPETRPARRRTRRRPPASALQIHNRYLVTETDEGVTIIDQHALHERILYEQLRQRVAAGAMETQSLLVPEPVDLSPTEAAAALEHRDLLAELGVKIEPFGGDTVLVAGYPAMLANMNPVDVLRALLERILAEAKRPDRRDLLDDLLHTIACKAAIKAGDRLAPEEIAALLEQRHLVDDAHHCPHGRPTALVFTREELDKQFKRI